MSAHLDELYEDWARLLLELLPHNVLDVGCGRGRVLELLESRGVECCGVEENTDRALELGARGLAVRRASAAELPFPDASFDVVSLRHVLHHLRDHEAALAEAYRVARKAVLVGEPHYAVEVPSQAAGARLDSWHKRRHDDSDGSVHRENLTVHEMLTSLRAVAGAGVEITIGSHVPLTCWRVEEIEERFGVFATALAVSDPERAEYAEFLELARGGLLTRGGTVWLRARKAGN